MDLHDVKTALEKDAELDEVRTKADLLLLICPSGLGEYTYTVHVVVWYNNVVCWSAMSCHQLMYVWDVALPLMWLAVGSKTFEVVVVAWPQGALILLSEGLLLSLAKVVKIVLPATLQKNTGLLLSSSSKTRSVGTRDNGYLFRQWDMCFLVLWIVAYACCHCLLWYCALVIVNAEV